ncbi:BQ5605_C004g03105 [Microbotryum silenes-dioicae]|uniref:BQ5605_C004g03105 protein n=1 Tax=Microbotryum silenes-dioicae TaxID=796604 RepID=A0A2X0PC11_9BASI|nr:BQ5605_C004g03105 [Microbotryum silenes-dioicae]
MYSQRWVASWKERRAVEEVCAAYARVQEKEKSCKTQFATRGIRPIKFYSGTLVLARTPGTTLHRPPRLLAAPSNFAKQ